MHTYMRYMYALVCAIIYCGCALTDGTNRFIIPGTHPITQDFVPRFAALDLLNDPHELAEKIFAQAQPAAHHHVPSRVLLSTRTHCCVQSVLR